MLMQCMQSSTLGAFMYYSPALSPVYPASFSACAGFVVSVSSSKVAADSEAEFRAVSVVAPLEGLKFETLPIQGVD